jgi:hypothetical protein
VFSDLVNKELKDISTLARTQLLHELEVAGKQVAVDVIAKSFAHGLLKAIDGVVAASIKVLPKEDANKLLQGYVDVIDNEVAEFAEAMREYVPLQITVELNKKFYGGKSDQANAARAKREAGIANFRTQFQDIVRVAIGETPVD